MLHYVNWVAYSLLQSPLTTTFLPSSLQFYLPPENLINKDFLKEVLAGKKELMKKSEIDYIEVPHYEELSVKTLYPMFSKDPAMMCYFPDKYPEGKRPPREYFFNVLNTVHPNYLEQIMGHANKQRMTAEGDAMKKESITVSEYWQEQLKSMPYLSCKYSKMRQYILILCIVQRRMARPCIS